MNRINQLLCVIVFCCSAYTLGIEPKDEQNQQQQPPTQSRRRNRHQEMLRAELRQQISNNAALDALLANLVVHERLPNNNTSENQLQ